MKKFLVLGLLFGVMGGIAGCENTLHGAGHDIENAGEWVNEDAR